MAKKKQPKTIQRVVIYYELSGKKHYVSETPKRQDGLIAASYSEDVEDAKDYDTEIEAQGIVNKIVNYNNRDFLIERVQVAAVKDNTSFMEELKRELT